MDYNIVPTEQFAKDLKRLFKKYPSIKEDVLTLVEELKKNPFSGTPLAKNCFKIRMAIKSKRKGKSGGSRVISHVRVSKEQVYLLTIYDKADKETVSDAEIINLLNSIDE